jgi:ribosomal protein S18 acetylase RimI-like enzyme
VTYERLEWDSRFFGFTVGRVDLDGSGPGGLAEAVADADADGARCLYLLCPAADDATLGAALDEGFRPYDIRVELELDAPAGTAPASVREAVPGDAEALDLITRRRFRGTRFWNDPHFDPARVEDLYSEWLRRGMTSASRRTLVAGEADGFIVCGLDGERGAGEIELIAVAAAAASKGVGADLVAAAGAAFAAAGLARATVVTQGRNVAALRLYERCGYRTERVDVWLHRWAS